jgi:hypothetical protein
MKVFKMVPEAGLEPARYFYRGILSPLCLPIPPLGHINWYQIFVHYTFISINVFTNNIIDKNLA